MIASIGTVAEVSYLLERSGRNPVGRGSPQVNGEYLGF